MKPRRAILLSAGLGTRMRPLSARLPKALMPLWGVPLLDHLFTLLRQWGVEEVLLNLHHRPDPLVRHLRTRRPDGLRVCCSFEPELLGTGGAVRKAAWFLDDRPFWLLNSDIALSGSPAPLCRMLRRYRGLAALWLYRGSGPRTVELAGPDIATFSSDRAGSPGTCTFVGVQLLRPDILRYLPAAGPASIVDAYRRAMAAGERVLGLEIAPCLWADLGSPDGYLAAHAEVCRAARNRTAGGELMRPPGGGGCRRLPAKGIRATGFASAGRGAVVEPPAELHNTVLWDRARLRKGTRAVSAIVAGGVVVSGHVEGMVLNAADLPRESWLRAGLDLLGWPAAGTIAQRLSARGSDRAFGRLQRGRKSFVVVHYGRERRENAGYAAKARFLRDQGVDVPRLVAHDARRRLTVLEDAGSLSLERMVRAAGAGDPEKVYRTVLRNAARLHAIAPAAARRAGVRLQAAFGAPLYRWEHELFDRWLLAPRLAGQTRLRRRVLRELEENARRLRSAPRVLLHRDLQSSNILLKGRRTVFIDFQGLRPGPAAYDAASLLCDPYVMLDPARQERLLACYERLRGPGAEVGPWFWPAAVQRLSQALGAFGRLASAPATVRFQRHVAPGLEMMLRAAARTGRLPALEEALHRL